MWTHDAPELCCWITFCPRRGLDEGNPLQCLRVVAPAPCCRRPHQLGLVPRRGYWLLPSQRPHGMAFSSSQTSLPLSSHFQLSALCDCTGRGTTTLANTNHQRTGVCRKNDSCASCFLSIMNQDRLQKACLTWSRARTARNPTGSVGSWQHVGIVFRECEFFS